MAGACSTLSEVSGASRDTDGEFYPMSCFGISVSELGTLDRFQEP